MWSAWPRLSVLEEFKQEMENDVLDIAYSSYRRGIDLSDNLSGRQQSKSPSESVSVLLRCGAIFGKQP